MDALGRGTGRLIAYYVLVLLFVVVAIVAAAVCCCRLLLLLVFVVACCCWLFVVVCGCCRCSWLLLFVVVVFDDDVAFSPILTLIFWPPFLFLPLDILPQSKRQQKFKKKFIFFHLSGVLHLLQAGEYARLHSFVESYTQTHLHICATGPPIDLNDEEETERQII